MIGALLRIVWEETPWYKRREQERRELAWYKNRVRELTERDATSKRP